MISSHRTPRKAILYIFIGTIQHVRHLGRGIDRAGKESSKNDIERRVCSRKSDVPHNFYVLFSATQTFLLGFPWSSKNITTSNKKSTSKNEPISVSEITIWYFHKNTIIPLLCQYGLFIHTCLSKNVIVFKDGSSTSFNITWCTETAMYTTNFFSSHSIAFYFLWATQGKW